MHVQRLLGAPLLLMLLACRSGDAADEITVRRINVVDEKGVVRFVIAGDAPDPILRGQRYPRAVSPAAILWHDEDGNESGGLAVAPLPDGRTMRMITFDFTVQPTDAVRIGTFESPDGERWMAGFEAFDRNPHLPGPIETSQGVRRIVLGTENAQAGLTILDPQERERIRIGVDAKGTAVFEILDESGAVVFRAPD
ncbi:MAG TPA: hypothetical protein VFT98_01145 [Myxococcota bacterium]|nr:hypothetical protein [Myxococcota bacterium]